MQYRRLGRTELMVAEVGAGTGSLPTESESAAETLRAAIDAGCTLIEFTIDDAVATAAIVEAIHRQRPHVLLVASGSGDSAQLEAAVEQLAVASVDLYLVDAGNVAALPGLRESELTRFAGVAATDGAEALAAIEGGEADVVQWPYHLATAEGAAADRVIAAAATADVGLIGCSPLAEGELLRGAAAEVIASLTAGAPRTSAQAAIAWALSDPRLAAVVVASRSAAQATENAEASDAAPLPEPELDRVAGLLA